MFRETINFLSAVLIVSKDAERLATFYREVIGLPLEDEKHGDTAKHYGCELGDLHFAIHPAENFPNSSPGVGPVKLAFNVFDMNAFVNRIEAAGCKPLYPPVDRGFAIMTALHDPDGNLIEFTQLSERWLKHIENRRARGLDIIEQSKKTR